MKILIADDDETNWLFMEHLLSSFGPCDRAVNGKEAVEFFEMALARGDPYNLVCMDIMMPVMDGQEALRRIREREHALGIPAEQEVVVFMVTALYGKEDRAEAFSRGGCTDYLIKPLRREDLLDKIEHYFDFSQPRQGGGPEKRSFSRPLFHARARLIPATGTPIEGVTQDVSFNSILFLPHGEERAPASGLTCLIQIALDDEAPIEECFVTFPCMVVRADASGIALRMVEAEHLTPLAAEVLPQERSRVVVRRSDGQLDSDWEILRHDDRLPADAAEQIARLALKKAEKGPVAVCFKKGSGSEQYLYKVLNVQYLKELQKLARFNT